MGTSSTRSQSRGLTARPASPYRRWNSWRSWRRSCRCHASTWCAMGAVWRRTVCCVGRSSRRRANRVWMGVRPTTGPPLELGAAAEAGVCSGYAPLPVLSAWRAADRCRHHPRGGDQRSLRHLHLPSVPPPIAPARSRQETFDWVAEAHAIAWGLVGDVCATEVGLSRGRHL